MRIELTTSMRVVRRLAGVQRAELFTIDPDDRRTALAGPDRFDGYPILSRGTVGELTPTRRLARVIGTAVFEPPENVAKGCRFVPHHGVRFFDPDGAMIDLTLCFTCGDARVSGFDGRFWLDKNALDATNALFRRHGVAPPNIDR